MWKQLRVMGKMTDHLFYLITSSCFKVFNILKSAEKVILTILFFAITCEHT